jgi:hypothetical protein
MPNIQIPSIHRRLQQGDAALIEKYGTPVCTWALYMGQVDAGERQKVYGQAIQTGQLRIGNIWELVTVLPSCGDENEFLR